jgi:hypothetical protein
VVRAAAGTWCAVWVSAIDHPPAPAAGRPAPPKECSNHNNQNVLSIMFVAVEEWCLHTRAVADLETAVSNVQLQHRGMFPTTADGTFVVGNSIKLSSYPQQPTRPFVAERGEHTVAVQAQLAKL